MALFSDEVIEKIDTEAIKVKEYEKNLPGAQTYYVNEVYIPEVSNFDKCCIGLFSGEMHWHGEGNFCGWYGVEYFDDMTLVAYYVVKNGGMFSPKGNEHLDEKIINEHFDKIIIGSSYWTKELFAKDLDTAIWKFFHEDF